MNILQSIKNAIGLVNKSTPITNKISAESKAEGVQTRTFGDASVKPLPTGNASHLEDMVLQLATALASRDEEISTLKAETEKRIVSEVNRRILMETGITVDRLPKVNLNPTPSRYSIINK